MAEIVAPDFGESVFEASVGRWFKDEGDAVLIGEPIVELHTDKAVQEINAVRSGVMGALFKQVDDVVRPGDALCEFLSEVETVSSDAASESVVDDADTTGDAINIDASGAADAEISDEDDDFVEIDMSSFLGPAPPSNPDNAESTRTKSESEASVASSENRPPLDQSFVASQISELRQDQDARPTRRERLSRRRLTTARRMAQVQAETVMTTTYNEVDMFEVIRIRRDAGDDFMASNGVKLGFMSFFVKAVLSSLKSFPIMNSELDDDQLVYKEYYDIGIAVASDHGLVVPVIRDADRKSFADIEIEIRGFADKARTGSFSLSDLVGGTFTITNGGVFGSMMSTPILNPPQVGILGMHNIVDRPVVVDGLITIRPMMYLAVTYDHRVVEGAQAVQFLMGVKRALESAEELMRSG